jgi:hypothetical protein
MSHSAIQNHRTKEEIRAGAGSRENRGRLAG